MNEKGRQQGQFGHVYNTAMFRLSVSSDRKLISLECNPMFLTSAPVMCKRSDMDSRCRLVEITVFSS